MALPRMQQRFTEGPNISRPWWMWLQQVDVLLEESGGGLFKRVAALSLTGTDQTVDSFKSNLGGAVFYFYWTRTGSTNKRGGMLSIDWLADGTMPSRPNVNDFRDMGDTSDLRFSFTYTDPKIYLKSTSTSIYRFSAVRLILP